jgi:inner membrane protein
MPTIFTHPAVPLALGIALGRKHLSPRLVATGVLATILPDFDSIAFKLGIAYADQFGHRGATHSLFFALAVGMVGAAAAPWLRTTRWRALWFLTLCTASHPVLDALTSGGLGVALFWPWSHERIFAPWRPIAVSPIGMGFFSARGLKVILSELQWVWSGSAILAIMGYSMRRALRPTKP